MNVDLTVIPMPPNRSGLMPKISATTSDLGAERRA